MDDIKVIDKELFDRLLVEDKAQALDMLKDDDGEWLEYVAIWIEEVGFELVYRIFHEMTTELYFELFEKIETNVLPNDLRALFICNITVESKKIKRRKIMNWYFINNTSFDSSEFVSRSFQSTKFILHASFKSCSFAKEVSFSKVYFNGGVSFHSACFNGDVYFESSIFKSSAIFSSTNFLKKGNFQYVNFHGRVSFNDSNFKREAKFLRASFYLKNEDEIKKIIKFCIDNNFLYEYAKVIINDKKILLSQYILDYFKKTGGTMSEVFLRREISFPPEYKQAGLNILNYFDTVLRQKYPEMDVKVTIQQDGLKVRMIVESSDSGNREIVEKTLYDYGLVVRGEILPEDFLNDSAQVIDLKNQLRIAQVQLDCKRELIQFQNASIERLNCIIGELTRKVGNTSNYHGDVGQINSAHDGAKQWNELEG